MANAPTQHLLAIVVAIRDCTLINMWESEFQSQFEGFELEEKFHAHKIFESMWRAALLFSVLSLRKVADFAESKGSKSDDIRLSDFGMTLQEITGEALLIDNVARDKINKGVAHLTTLLDPDVDEMEELRQLLISKEEDLQKLGDKFFAMITDGRGIRASPAARSFR